MHPRPAVTEIEAVGHPGGLAPQFHVHYLSISDDDWVMYGCFERGEQAEECRRDLTHRGLEARIVSHRIYPTAG